MEAVLIEGATDRELQQVFWFLFKKRNESEYLNVRILLNHLKKLNESESDIFMKSIFSGSSGYRSESWRDNVSGLLSSFINLSEEKNCGWELQLWNLYYFSYHMPVGLKVRA
ncbi:hypothetical protein P2W49_07590 [Yersinia intermedia]|nr:hypothetical protein P2W49_07590 [Yersinia intermedia]